VSTNKTIEEKPQPDRNYLNLATLAADIRGAATYRTRTRHWREI